MKPNEVRWFIPDMDNKPEANPAGIDVTERILSGTATDDEQRDAVSREFIPALYTDNKIGLALDPKYPARIRMQGKKHEQALLNGDPEAFSGDFFDQFSPSRYDPKNVSGGGMMVEPFKIPKEWKFYGSLDPGWSSPCSFGLKAIDFRGRHYRILTYYKADAGMQQNVDAIASMIDACPWTDGRKPKFITSGHDAWAKHEHLAIQGKELTYAELFRQKDLVLVHAVRDRVVGWGAWKNLMQRHKWFYFENLNEPLVDEIQGAEHDENDVEDIKGRGNDPEVPDHAIEEERYSVMASFAPAEREPEPTGIAKKMRDKAKREGVKWEAGMP